MRTKTTMTMIKIKIMRMVSTGLMMTTTTVRMITMISGDDGADNAIMIMLMKMMMLKMINCYTTLHYTTLPLTHHSHYIHDIRYSHHMYYIHHTSRAVHTAYCLTTRFWGGEHPYASRFPAGVHAQTAVSGKTSARNRGRRGAPIREPISCRGKCSNGRFRQNLRKKSEPAGSTHTRADFLQR